MPFASFKNAQKRYARLHRERAQPERRKHLGILPKKRDFVQRARAKEKKDVKIKELKRLALTRNEDEFYFNMCNSTFDPEKGHIPLNATKEYSDNQLISGLNLSVAQLRFELGKEWKRIRKLEASASLLQGDHSLRSRRAPAKHTIFVETSKEARKVRSRLKEDPSAFPSVASSSSSVKQLPESVVEERDHLYSELERRLTRASTIELMLKKKEAKQNLAKNRDKLYRVVAKDKADTAPVYKFESIRNR